MEREVYRRMAALQHRHWWFVGRRRVLTAVLDRLDLPAGVRILEAGCGMGGNLAMLSRFGEVHGFEPNAEARAFVSAQMTCDLRDGRLPDGIPFAPGGFDLVAALDVIEHLDDDRASLRALAAQLRPGGRLVVTVPAWQFLWSQHDESHHHRRRYGKRELLRLVNEAGLRAELVTYFNSLLFPVVVAVRLFNKLLGRGEGADDALPPAVVNRLLTTLFAVERFVVGRLPMPAGVSLLVVAHRDAAGAEVRAEHGAEGESQARAAS